MEDAVLRRSAALPKAFELDRVGEKALGRTELGWMKELTLLQV